jgi:hypothetical protein
MRRIRDQPKDRTGNRWEENRRFKPCVAFKNQKPQEAKRNLGKQREEEKDTAERAGVRPPNVTPNPLFLNMAAVKKRGSGVVMRPSAWGGKGCRTPWGAKGKDAPWLETAGNGPVAATRRPPAVLGETLANSGAVPGTRVNKHYKKGSVPPSEPGQKGREARFHKYSCRARRRSCTKIDRITRKSGSALYQSNPPRICWTTSPFGNVA